MSTFGGIYIVPLYALIQQRSDRSHVSRVIASNNIINALLMVLSAILAIVFLKMGFTIPQLFLLVSILNALVAFYIFTLVPEFIMRFLIWLLIHTFYRVETKDLDKLPDEGASVLVCNHVSYLDALIIAGYAPRPVRFVMHYKIYQLPVLNFIFRTAKAIPIAGVKEDKEMLEHAFQQVSETLQAGELVCIFPEGRITNNGEMQPFLLGISQIIEANPVPVIPMALCGMWGTFFSRQGGAAMSRFPRRLWSKIALVIGDSVPPNEVSARGLYEKVLALRGDWK
jgi:1-acyl-sn-glycerol-3-phosphate acyltransferase